MTQIKAIGLAVTLGVLCLGSFADELAVGPATMLATPGVRQIDGQLPYRAIGVSGTNAVIVTSVASLSGVSYLSLNRLDSNGRPINEPPRFVVPEFYISTYPELSPAEGGYFLRYVDHTNHAAVYRQLVTRIDFDGKPAFAPVVVTTNSFNARAASNGRALLLLMENRGEVDYTILSYNGGIISTGVFEGGSSGRSFAAASDGKDFLAVWSANDAPYLRATHISGSNGSSTTTGFVGTRLSVQAIGYGKNGYLVAGLGSLLHLRNDGTLVAKTAFPMLQTTSQNVVIYPEGEDWILFMSGTEALASYRITPTSEGLRIQDGSPYPVVEGIFSQPSSSIAPFGPGRFLVAGKNSITLLTKTTASNVGNALVYTSQGDGRVTASPFGYLVSWTERLDSGNHSLRAIRFAPDGSALDDDWFEIATFYRGRAIPSGFVFDGKDYIISWNNLTVARISPQGAPDIRIQSYSINTVPADSSIQVISHKDELFASYSAMNPSAPNLFIWKLSPDGQVSPEVVVHGYGAFSDGANLFSIGLNERAEVFKILVDPSAPNPEISTNIIAAPAFTSATQPFTATQLRYGFVVRWFEGQESASFAYFVNGKEQWRDAAPGFIPPVFADTNERLLMATLTPYPNRFTRFDTFNLETGEKASVDTDLPLTALHAASSGRDFLALATSFNLEMPYVLTKFWITTTKPPAFTELHINQDTLATTTLNLNPTRRYRIETSSDLVNWDLRQVVSGSTTANFTLPGGDPQAFARAILVPE